METKIYTKDNIFYYVQFSTGLFIEIQKNNYSNVQVCGNRNFSDFKIVSLNSLKLKLRNRISLIINQFKNIKNGIIE